MSQSYYEGHAFPAAFDKKKNELKDMKSGTLVKFRAPSTPYQTGYG